MLWNVMEFLEWNDFHANSRVSISKYIQCDVKLDSDLNLPNLQLYFVPFSASPRPIYGGNKPAS